MAPVKGKRRFGLPGFYARPLKRLKEIECISHWRQRQGQYTNPVTALAVAGHALAALEGMRRRNAGIHPGLDFATAEEFLERAGLDLTERDVMEVVADVARARSCERPFIMTDVEAGKLLDLTRAERTNLGIVTIEAIDESAADRAARTAEWKRFNDRLRRRRATDKRRVEAGLPPLDRSGVKPSSAKPWEAAGMTKATYYRRKAKGQMDGETSVSRTYVTGGDETAVSRTYTNGSETAVSRSLRSNVEVSGHASLSLVPASAAGGGSADRHLDTVAQAETRLLLFLGEGSIRRGRTVSELLGPGTVKAWFYLHSQGLMSPEQIVRAEAAVSSARAAANQPEAERGAA